MEHFGFFIVPAVVKDEIVNAPIWMIYESAFGQWSS